MSEQHGEDVLPDSDAERVDEGIDPVEAAREALARARLAARDRGYRPGGPVRRSRKAADLGAARGTARAEGRDPGLLGDQLDRLLVDRGWQVEAAAGSVIARWPEIVGAGVADHCVVGSFEEGVLTVQAESTAWRTQLEYLESALLTQIDEAVGAGVVTKLRFVGPRQPSWKHGRLLAPGSRGPRDTYG